MYIFCCNNASLDAAIPVITYKFKLSYFENLIIKKTLFVLILCQCYNAKLLVTYSEHDKSRESM